MNPVRHKKTVPLWERPQLENLQGRFALSVRHIQTEILSIVRSPWPRHAGRLDWPRAARLAWRLDTQRVDGGAMRIAVLGACAGLAALLILLLGQPGRAAAGDLSIEAFYGNFAGSGIARSDDSDYFGLTVRDFDVTIRPAPNGLSISWTTVIRQGGDPATPDIRRKADSLVFMSTDRAGVYRAANAGDPLSGAPFAWARLADQTLTVHSLAVLDDGGYVMQTYNRTVNDLGMALEFISVRDGETARRVTGRLTKQSD